MSSTPTSNSPPNSPYSIHRPSSSCNSIDSSVSESTFPDAQAFESRVKYHTDLSVIRSPTIAQSKSTTNHLLDSRPSQTGSLNSRPYTQMEKEKPGKGGNDATRSSPSASSSQGDMADNEMDMGTGSQPTEESAAPPPPKKKRTRTLTTPHQSAVLHALLAQSRFPTTAMREEVGRAIGLSARKVQNQRQKARRPKGNSGPPLTRPPQFGPFTNTPQPGALGDPQPVAGPSTSAESGTSQRRARSGRSALPAPLTIPPPTASSSGGSEYYHESHFPEGHRMSAGSSSQLSGPGVPGSSSDPLFPSHRELFPRGLPPRIDAARRMPVHPELFQPFAFNPSRPTTSTGESLEIYRTTPRPLHPQVSDEEDFSITLPPLRLDRPQSPSRTLPSPTARLHPYPRGLTSPHNTLPPIGNRRDSATSVTSESPFAHEVPRIPPPFTLQPTPMWDDPAFSPYNRPGSSRSRPGSGSYEFSSNPPRTPHRGPYGRPRSPPVAGPSHRHTLSSPTLPPVGPSSSRQQPTLSPIRTRFDTIRAAARPSTQRSTQERSPHSESPSRPHHADDTNLKRNVSP